VISRKTAILLWIAIVICTVGVSMINAHSAKWNARAASSTDYSKLSLASRNADRQVYVSEAIALSSGIILYVLQQPRKP
jgi:hypothetical protein